MDVFYRKGLSYFSASSDRMSFYYKYLIYLFDILLLWNGPINSITPFIQPIYIYCEQETRWVQFYELPATSEMNLTVHR